ncbi:MAG: PhzF family phenazine biosynthesis protein [Actinomycetota bacterium]|nr:PhzF family phenazine biosynthesis protein [Actinomycetota bacterium]
MTLRVVDAFTDRPFTGNPAAVAVVERFPTDAYMQAVAREMNLAETAFVVTRPDGDHDLRWFTPTTEVDLCGHATLAAAHLLGGSARFHTRSGPLICRSVDEGFVEMDFPADPPAECDPPAFLGLSGVRWYGRGRFDALVELADASAVRSLEPDLASLARIDARAVIVTAAGDRDGIDCVSRVFGPNVGVAEDPVTGSAHCTLAVFWGERQAKTRLVGEQASARGGTVRMERRAARVLLGGQAVTVGEMRLTV